MVVCFRLVLIVTRGIYQEATAYRLYKKTTAAQSTAQLPIQQVMKSEKAKVKTTEQSRTEPVRLSIRSSPTNWGRGGK